MKNLVIHATELGACGLFAASMATDLHRRWIPNEIPALLLVLFSLYAWAGADGPDPVPWNHLAVGAVMLAAGFALYMTGRFGAGDGKLLAVAGLWIGPSLGPLGLYLCGLAVGAFVLSAVALLPFERTRSMRAELPFAVAIAAPAVIVLLLRALSGTAWAGGLAR